MESGEKFGVLEYGFWIFLLVAVGRVGELIPGLGSLPLAKIAVALPLVIRLVRHSELPRLTAATRPLARTGRWLIFLAILLTFVSIWPGASVTFLYADLTVLVACVSIAYVMGRCWRTVRATLFVLVLCGVVLARAALARYTGGRAATATMYDTNDLAYVLAIVLPVSIGFILCAKTVARRMAHLGVTGALVAAMLLTQSRGGLLALVAVVILTVFFKIRAPDKQAGAASKRRGKKIWLLIGVIGLGFLTWSYLPEDARGRFSTMFDLGKDYNLDPTATTGRGQIWSRALRATVDRPIGFGPDAFAMVDWKYGGKFNAPHNIFLEVVVELGILGLILFVRMYILAFRGLSRARKALIARESLSIPEEEQVVFARMLQISLVASAVAGFFLSMAYSTLLWIVFGLSMAMMYIAEQIELGARQPTAGSGAVTALGHGATTVA